MAKSLKRQQDLGIKEDKILEQRVTAELKHRSTNA